MTTPRVIFVTDPICSWCWGTLPEVQQARLELSDHIEFDLMMGGLRVDNTIEINDYEYRRLQRLWHEVNATTGQNFCGVIPDGFRYNSEIPCRAVEVVRQASGEPPWDFFHNLQHAFYTDARNLSDVDVLSDIAGFDLAKQLDDPNIVNATRSQFGAAKAAAANALPSVLLDVGEGPRLLSGGYITVDFLVAEITHRTSARSTG